MEVAGLKESDQLKIAVFSPSSPPEPEKTEKGLAIIRESRLDIRQAPEHSPSPFPYLAGDDQCQAEAFTRLMQDPEIDVLWAARGGYGISRWIDMVEWDQIDDPPLVTGFSDLTFLHAALSKKTSIQYTVPWFPPCQKRLIRHGMLYSDVSVQDISLSFQEGRCPVGWPQED
ncbi:MAG TPA: hypothetical protein EYP57_02265 [Thermodesulfobacteriaceae bacterium]|nr:hypothetical protein [Thermodesulfobacteriaceae bacterium]